MATITITTNLSEFITRIEEAKAALAPLVVEAMTNVGNDLVQQLSDAAPRGTGEEATPPEGDASGRLAESFVMEAESDEMGAHVVVSTTQPQKLEWVRYGRGEVLPVVKKALFWPGLDHPVRRAGPSQPNDFVSPIVDSAAEMLYGLLDEAVAEVAAQL